MYVDYILNGEGHGAVGEAMAECRFDAGLLRPFKDKRGIPCVMVNTGRAEFNKEKGGYVPILEKMTIHQAQSVLGINNPVLNATSLRKDEWLMLDQVVILAARRRLRAWADLAASNTFGGFNGMGKTVLEYETMSDPGEAVVDMDGLTDGRTDAPRYQLEGLPLPIIHSDFWFSERRLATSRNTGMPLDSVMAEAAGRRVGEKIEQLVIGTATGMIYGDGSGVYGRTNLSSGTAPQIYGYTNFPQRNTVTTMTAPDGTNGTTVLSDWLTLREAAFNDNFFGPFIAYTSSNYDQYLDNEFKTNSDKSLRNRLLEIDGITAIRRLDFLTTDNVVVLVQMTPEVARAVVGMDITTVQWESSGGLRKNFKVMAIHVPQLRSDFDGRCGIVHGTTS